MADSKRSLVNDTIAELVAYISKNELLPGTKLPNEKKLAEILHVGRSTLREAVKILSYSNVLEVKHGSGTYIKNLSSISEYSQEQLLAVREMLERQAVELITAADYNLEEMIALKEVLFKRNHLLEEGKFSDYITADLEFHSKIIALAKNPFLLKWYEEIKPELRTYLSAQVLKLTSYADNTAIHNELYQALLDGDSQTAKEKISGNIRKVRKSPVK